MANFEPIQAAGPRPEHRSGPGRAPPAPVGLRKNLRIFRGNGGETGRSIRTMPTRRGRSILVAMALSLAGAGSVPPSVAHAAPSAAEQREAKAAWEKGKKEMARKRWSAAASAFRDADVIDPKAQYKLDLARALLRQGAARQASDVLDDLAKTSDGESASVRGAADELREQVERRLATIVVEVSGATAGVEVEVDGAKVKPGDVVRVDPGKHLVAVRARGWIPMEQTVVLKERQTEAVAFRLERDPAAAPLSEPEAAPEEEEEAPAPRDDHGGTLLPAAIAWGIGGAGIALGTVFGIFAFGEAEKAKEGCVDNVCPRSNVEAIDASRDNGTASTICFAVGGAGLVTGVVLAIVFGSGDPPEAGGEGAAFVRPVVGPAGGGLVGRF